MSTVELKSSMPQITTHILGSGLAGKAIAKALSFLKITDDDIPVGEIVMLPRDVKLYECSPDAYTVLCIANPSALHAPRIIEAAKAGYGLILCEKPTSTDRSQLEILSTLQPSIPIAVFHVYRQLWGIQHIKTLITTGVLGRIIAIEGRLWQPSRVGHYSAQPVSGTKREWVGDKSLTGEYGVSLGLGTHWLDAAQFLAGEKLHAKAHYVDSLRDGSGNDDTYINFQFQSAGGTFISGSVANIVHASRNDFEIMVIGEKGSAEWTLMEPDQISIGHGRDRTVVYRQDTTIGSCQPPFHGVGWLEGYIEILRQAYRQLLGRPYSAYPTLTESNETVRAILDMMALPVRISA